MICADAMATKCDRLLVAFDGDKVFRFKLYPKYKGERGASSPAYDYLDALKTYLSKAGVPVFHFQEYEADDVLASVATQCRNVICGTRDKDSHQYLKEGVELYDSGAKPKPILLTHEQVQKIDGMTGAQFLDYQTLIGDKIDCVPQLVSPAKAKKGILNHGSLKKWMAKDAEFRAAMTEIREEFLLNRKLVKMKTDLPVRPFVSVNWAPYSEDFPKKYFEYKDFCNPKSKGLF